MSSPFATNIDTILVSGVYYKLSTHSTGHGITATPPSKVLQRLHA